MGFEFAVRWKFRGKDVDEIDPRLFVLLAAIRDRGSLRAAAEVAGLSYRHAWGLIRYWSDRISRPIARLERGRGASLTPVGEKLLWAEQVLDSRIVPGLSDISDELNNEFSLLFNKQPDKTLRINASHGLAIAHLQALLERSNQLQIDFHFRGSLESLRELAAGHCDIAGFHFPVGKAGKNLSPLYKQWLDQDKYRLVHVASRQQGLMLQEKNLHKITDLKSLTKRSVRFINRQQESGTRTIFDELLRLSGIKPGDIKGYTDEEFTHVAVAAVVASGTVDAGFGIKAAASRFGLHFIPLIEENYMLAMDRNIPDGILRPFEKILNSRAFRQYVRQLPGYDLLNTGKDVNSNDVFDSYK